MKNQINDNSLYDTIIRLIILFFIVGWCLMIMTPFANIILWSIILAIAILPLHKSLSKRLKNRPKLASSIIVLTMAIILLVPMGVLISALVVEVKDLKELYTTGALTIPHPSEKVKELPLIGNKLYGIWESTSVSIGNTIIKYKDQLTTFGKNLAKGLLGSFTAGIQIFVAFIIAGFLLVIPRLRDNSLTLFRKIAGESGDDIADTIVKTIGSVVKGVLGVALILALLHGIVFILAGVPFAGMLALGVFVLSVLQLPSLILTIPVMFYIYSEHSLTGAIIWTVVLIVVGLSDNFLKPILLGKGAPVPMLVIFIGVIGGFILSGFIGLFTGAIVMSVGYKLFIRWIEQSNNQMESKILE